MIEWIAHSAVAILFAFLLSGVGWLIGFGLPTVYEFFIFCMIGDLMITRGEDVKKTDKDTIKED